MALPLALVSACGDAASGAEAGSGSSSTTGGATTAASVPTTGASVPTTSMSSAGATDATSTGDSDSVATSTVATTGPTEATTGATTGPTTETTTETTTDTTTGGPIAPGGCVESVDGWCWTHPLPHGNTLHNVWSDGAGRVWVVGEGGTIMFNAGQGWQTLPADHWQGLRAVWGAAPDDVWAVGDAGLILHHDGVAWTDVASPTVARLHALWGSGPADIWASGEQGVILHHDGALWTKFDPGLNFTASRALWGFGPDDVWAGTDGFSGAAIHWDGVAWSYAPVDVGGNVRALWGRGPNDLYAALDQGPFLAHWTGGPAWEVIDLIGDAPMYGLAGTDTEVWAGGRQLMLHDDGNEWAPWAGFEKSELHGLARVDDDIIAVGARGVISRLHDGAWAFEAGDPTKLNNSFLGVWGFSADDVWAGGQGMAHWDGASWTFVDIGLDNQIVADISGAGGVLWAISNNNAVQWLWRHDGGEWVKFVQLPDMTPSAIWAVDATSAWIAGNLVVGDVVLWDGQTMTPFELPNSTFGARDIHGLAVDDVWAVGDAERLWHFDGVTWVKVHETKNGDDLTTVWAVGPDDVWAAGLFGDFYHYDGVTWTEYAGPTHYGISELWGAAPDDVWAVGGWIGAGYGSVYHYDGETWTQQISGAGSVLAGIWGPGPETIWVVGGQHSALVRRR